MDESANATAPEEENNPQVAPEILIAFSSDKKQVFLTIKQTPPEPYLATVDDVYQALSDTQFKGNILFEKIEEIITSQTYPNQELIGQFPIPKIKVIVSRDKLQAFLTIEQTPASPYMTTAEDISKVLQNAQVEFGILTEKIEQIVAEKQYPVEAVIAQGKAAQPGQDGNIEYLFSRAQVGRAKEIGYRVDYHDLNLVENVTAEQVLARQQPAVEGIPGKTVLGKTINVPKVKKVRLPVGKGTKISDTNPLELVAEVDGFVRLDQKSFDQVVVEQEFQVHTDVDLSTGNLDIEGSVRIAHDVKEGFTVKATGDIIVNGSVEGCTLHAGGMIEIKGGIIGGKQRARAQAGEDIIVKFADNADISAQGIISIADEVLNCNLQTEETIIVGERGKSMGAIIGGQAIAGSEIRAVTVGTSAGTPTRLRVGERPSLLARRQNMERELRQHTIELEQFEVRIQSLGAKYTERRPAWEERKVQLAKLEAQQKELYQTMKIMLKQGEEAGLVTPHGTIVTMQNEIEETQQTLSRVQESALKLLDQISDSGSPSEADQEMLLQLKLARQNLTNKLKTQEIHLNNLTKDPWKRLPWAWRRELDVSQAKLKNIAIEVAEINKENQFDEKIAYAISQSVKGRTTTEETLETLETELTKVQQEIDTLSKVSPHVIVTGKLWAGTEVIILRKKERFNQTLTAVRIQLSSTDDRKSVITLPL